MFSKTNVPNIGDYDIVYGSTQMFANCDAIWASNMDDRKFTSSNVFLLKNGASTKKANFYCYVINKNFKYGNSQATSQAMWLSSFFGNIGIL